MARQRRTASNPTAPETAPEETQAPEPTQEVAETNAAPETPQEPVVSTVTETPEQPTPEVAVDAPAEAPQAEQAPAVEAPTEGEAAQSPEGQAPTEGEGAAPAAQPEEKPKTADELFDEFKAILETAVAEADQSTGTPAEIHKSQSLEAYRKLPSTAKKADARDWMTQDMVECMNSNKVPRARTFMEILKLINEATARRTAATPAKPSKSPTEQYVEDRLALELSWNFLGAPKELDNDAFQNAYSGLKQEVAGQIEAYQAWFLNPDTEKRGDEPEVHDVVKNAAKIAAGKTPRRSTRKSSGGGSTGGSTGGARGDVAKHIQEFLASVESGSEHPVSAIAKFKSSEYPEGNASAGAISARLFPKDKETNIEGVTVLADASPKKVRKN